MAKKPTEDRSSSNNPRDRIVDALMALAAVKPWDEVTLADIAREAAVSLADFRDHFPSKGAILAALSRKIDRKVLEGTGEDLAGEPARERLFDVLMRRIDALAPYKPALRNIADGLRTDPLALLAMNQVALNSQRFMLTAAGIDTEDALGPLRLQGAVLAFARTLDTWLEDDDPGLARTLARLDRELTRGERLLGYAEDAHRLSAPLRAFARALVDRSGEFRRRHRDRPSRRRDEPKDDEDFSPVQAI